MLNKIYFKVIQNNKMMEIILKNLQQQIIPQKVILKKINQLKIHLKNLRKLIIIYKTCSLNNY